MREIIFFILILLFPNFCFAQKEFNLTKSSDNDIILDGIISEDEKRNSKIATIDFEQEPGDNIPTKLKSEVLIVLDPTFTATLALPSEKKPAQPTEPIKVMIITAIIISIPGISIGK